MRLVAVAAALAIVMSGCIGGFWTGRLDGSVEAPSFSITDVEGQSLNLTDYHGRVVLLDFMGTWCGPCQRAVPVLEDMQAAYPELTVISVSGTDTEEELRFFQAQYGAHWPHVADLGVVRDYLEAGSSGSTMMWPSYAIIDPDGRLVFYNRGETLPATFTAVLDDLTTRSAPSLTGDAIWPIGLAFVLGFASWTSPFLLRHTVARDERRPIKTWALPLLMYGGMGVLAAWFSRPLSGRVATIAPFLIVGAVLAIAVWRTKGTEAVQIEGKRIDAEGPWRHASGFWGNTLWYLLPVWGVALHAAMLRTSSLETLLIPLALGLGLVAAEATQAWPVVRDRLRSAGERVGWIGASALIVAAAWNGVLLLR